MFQFGEIDAVLFDLDGTLIDSAPDLGAAADKMRTDRGLASLALELYRPMAGAGARGMLEVALDIQPDHADYALLREEFFVNYENSLIARTTVFAEVPELIAQLLQHRLVWGVVTNKSQRFTEPLTRAMPLFGSAGAIVSGDSTAHAKPHPAPLLEAARRLGLPPERCLYVGDDHRDIVAGLAAGMGTVAVSYGYLGKKSDIENWGADAAIAAPGELLRYLKL